MRSRSGTEPLLFFASITPSRVGAPAYALAMNELADRVARLLAAGDTTGAEAAVAAATTPSDQALGQAVLALYRKDPAAIGHAERALALGAGAAAHQYLAVAHL